ncbi:MAG: hypothetical protein ACJAU6_001089 [Alphaproteobacteria bacterium]|jgi:hypothetical protein
MMRYFRKFIAQIRILIIRGLIFSSRRWFAFQGVRVIGSDGLSGGWFSARPFILDIFLEGFKAFAKIAHQVRDFAFAAEQHQDDDQYNNPVPDTKCAHVQ